jgi:hypothetical protein
MTISAGEGSDLGKVSNSIVQEGGGKIIGRYRGRGTGHHR